VGLLTQSNHLPGTTLNRGHYIFTHDLPTIYREAAQVPGKVLYPRRKYFSLETGLTQLAINYVNCIGA
jgi:hypothetical protein